MSRVYRVYEVLSLKNHEVTGSNSTKWSSDTNLVLKTIFILLMCHQRMVCTKDINRINNIKKNEKKIESIKRQITLT